jgi:hypothetical protein
MMRLQEMLETCNDQNLKLKIIKTIADIRYKCTHQFAQFPARWSLDALVKNHNPGKIEQPRIPSLSGITGT